MATNRTLSKLVPSTVAMAVAGWCTWTTLTGPDSVGDGPRGKLPEIAPALLSPRIGAAPGRDPFKSPDEAQPDVLAKIRYKDPAAGPKAGTRGLAVVENERIARVVEALRDALTFRRGKARNPPVPKGGPAPKVNMAALLAGLALKATWVQGPSRVAVINGRIYRQGEALEGRADATLARVLPDRVLLDCRGERAELTFPEIAGNPTAPAVAPTGRRPAPKSGRKTAARTPTKAR